MAAAPLQPSAPRGSRCSCSAQGRRAGGVASLSGGALAPLGGQQRSTRCRKGDADNKRSFCPAVEGRSRYLKATRYGRRLSKPPSTPHVVSQVLVCSQAPSLPLSLFLNKNGKLLFTLCDFLVSLKVKPVSLETHSRWDRRVLSSPLSWSPVPSTTWRCWSCRLAPEPPSLAMAPAWAPPRPCPSLLLPQPRSCPAPPQPHPFCPSPSPALEPKKEEGDVF